jgi:HK97 family phage major capsid protein
MNTIAQDINLITDKIAKLDAMKAKGKRDFTRMEQEVYDDLRNEVARLRSIPASSPLTQGGDSPRTTQKEDRGYTLRGPSEPKDYRSLYGNRNDFAWTDKESSFFEAVFSGRHHPGLLTRGMTEGIPSDGGFLVPTQLAAQIHAVSLENEIVMPRCFVQPMMSNAIKIPAMAIGNHSANLYGGFTASYVGEAGAISTADPKVRNMELNAKKLTGMVRFSAELSQDIPGGESQLISICGKGLAWYRDKAFLKGTGAGQPLGILNSGCTISVAKETGQKADTIVYENLVKMVGRLHPACFNNAVWICQVSAIPQLLQLSMAIGMGGAAYPVLSEANGTWQILTRPVVFTEKTEKLGDAGDIILADFSQYVVGLRSEMRFDTSIHVHFETDELLGRLIERHDGQPLWESPMTLEDGSTTVSPFVTLAERA